ncbi:MAG: OsmC family protein [Bacteroidota bacterium]|nr:OsmC family protein [Bacteroidota bacterium]
MAEKIITKWKEGMAFEWTVNNHKLTIDAEERVGGKDKGPQPKPFMLASLGGCAAMDVISILKKMRVTENIEDFQVNVEGHMTDEHPKHYDKMHTTYTFKAKEGEELPMKKLEKAVSLSEDRYCGVTHVYKQTMELTSEIIIAE